jgi:hypothetical protein
MIHDWDTHYWLARTPDGWISAEDHSSLDPEFQTARRVRIEPLSPLQSIQAIIDAVIPPGYTAFLRTDIHRDMASGQIVRLGYVLVVEKGSWPDPGKMAIGGFLLDKDYQATTWEGLPLVDGFRSELCTWNGQVAFEASPNFGFERSIEGSCDLYKFDLR